MEQVDVLQPSSGLPFVSASSSKNISQKSISHTGQGIRWAYSFYSISFNSNLTFYSPPCTRLPVEASISCLATFLRAFRHTLISSYLWSLANSPSKPHMFLIVCFQYLKSHSSRNLQWPCIAVPQKDLLPDQSQPPQLLRTRVRNSIHKTQNRANARYQHLKLQPSQVKMHTHQCKYIINNIYNNMYSLVQSNCYSIGLSNAIQLKHRTRT